MLFVSLLLRKEKGKEAPDYYEVRHNMRIKLDSMKGLLTVTA